MESSAAEERYTAAESAMNGRAWADAVRNYKAAQGFKQAYKDTNEKIATAHYAWAEEEWQAKHYRNTAEHFTESRKAAGPGFRDAGARAATIYSALGRYFLQRQYCRQAVRDLRTARETSTDTALAEDLATAEACAITPVAILPFENPTGTNVAGMALGDTIADAIGMKVKARASEFVRLVERSALDQILSEQGLSVNGVASGGSHQLRGVRYLVLGKLTQVVLDQPGISVASKTAQGTEPNPCTKTRKDGTPYEATCFRDVTVAYRENAGRISLHTVSSVKVVDVHSGEQVTTLAVNGSSEDAVLFATGFKVNGLDVTITSPNRSDGIGVQANLQKLASARNTLKSDNDLAQAVVEQISTEASVAILAAVDGEKPASDPSNLELVSIE
jgi:tetratricopeptide (TPR) repeat protein